MSSAVNKAVNNANGCDEIPELFKSLKDDSIKVLHSLCQPSVIHLEDPEWLQDWKRSILVPVPRKGSTKECANHQIVVLISHTNKVMLKILHANTRIQKAHSRHSNLNKMKRQRNTQQVKEHEKCPPSQAKEEEIGNLPEKEFRIMIIKMIQNLENNLSYK